MTAGDGLMDPTDRLGRADLHIHTLASDGTAPVTEILDRVEREAVLDVIAITDHERIDAALAARRDRARPRAPDPGWIVGEEIGTRGGHLLGLFLERAGTGPAQPPLVHRRRPRAGRHSRSPPTPSSRTRCAPGVPAAPPARRRGSRAVRPDAIETFNPTALGRYWHERVVQFATEHEWPRSATATPTRPRRSARAGRRSRGGTEDALRAAVLGAHHQPSRELPRHGGAARDLRAPAAQVRPGRARRGSAGGCAATGPGGTTATPAGTSGRRASQHPEGEGGR